MQDEKDDGMMNNTRRGLVRLALLGLFGWSAAMVPAGARDNPPYDVDADAQADVAHALEEAASTHRQVMLVFGANWCPDCRSLDAALHGRTGTLLAGRFILVKVDVGNFDHNMDLDERFGRPTAKGIPSVVLLGDDGKVRYATRAGELADARHLGETGIYDFMVRMQGAQP